VLVVFLQLGALVSGNRVFQCQRMQAEFVAQVLDGLAVGRFEFDPDEAVRPVDVVADVFECNRLGLSLGVAEKQAVDGGLRYRDGCSGGILAAMRQASQRRSGMNASAGAAFRIARLQVHSPDDTRQHP
jgi:hypothetical protein